MQKRRGNTMTTSLAKDALLALLAVVVLFCGGAAMHSLNTPTPKISQADYEELFLRLNPEEKTMLAEYS